jgi:hypothetical protein
MQAKSPGAEMKTVTRMFRSLSRGIGVPFLATVISVAVIGGIIHV